MLTAVQGRVWTVIMQKLYLVELGMIDLSDSVLKMVRKPRESVVPHCVVARCHIFDIAVCKFSPKQEKCAFESYFSHLRLFYWHNFRYSLFRTKPC